MLLTKEQLDQLRDHDNYQRLIAKDLGAKAQHLAESDSVSPVEGCRLIRKIHFRYRKRQIIERELTECTHTFLRKRLNRDEQWPRDLMYVKEIFRKRRKPYIWVRWDRTCVSVVLNHSLAVLQDDSFRDLILTRSDAPDKEKRYATLVGETIILARAIPPQVHGLIRRRRPMPRSRFYEQHASEMVRTYMSNQTRGALGNVPTPHQEESLHG